MNRQISVCLSCIVGFGGLSLGLFGHWIIAGICCVCALWFIYCALVPIPDVGPGLSKGIRLGPMLWELEDFLRHFLIIGRSGCGKTKAAVKRLMISFYFTHQDAGGLVTDEKGDFGLLVEKVFKAIGLERKVLFIQTPLPKDAHIHPKAAINLIGDKRFSWASYAELVQYVAVSQGQRSKEPFFATGARDAIADAFNTLEAAELPVTLANTYEFFKADKARQRVLDRLEETIKLYSTEIDGEIVCTNPIADKAKQMIASWDEFFEKAQGESSGIKSTAQNYLRPYAEEGLINTFSASGRDDLLTIEVMDKGRVVVPTIPQAYAGRSYIMAFFKLLYYRHGLLRYDNPDLSSLVPLVLWADEGQNSLLPTEGGLSDLTSLDKLRAARCTVVFAMQDYVSAIPAIDGTEKADVLFVNLNNTIIFSLNSPKGRKIASDQIGEEEQVERSYSYDPRGRKTMTISKRMKPILPPTYFRKLRRFQCVILHCEGQYLTTTLPPVTDDGKGVESWYRSVSLRDLMFKW